MAEVTTQGGSLGAINKALRTPDIQFAVVLLGMIFMMIIPLPPMILDLLLSLSIIFGVLVLLVAIYVREPLDFSTFPTILLLTTLFRLSLNVATTRSILLDGATGRVSKVVQSFGEFVVGGNYFVGFVVFVILVIINFIVITKGAGRVAEVGARFTLDAMPGKQMSIDAELNAGHIDQKEATTRRRKIENEADFYGSMDGASKFVRGDAIAGIVITIINIVVGLIVGVSQYQLSFGQSAEVFTLLTVGDGLVSQIPALIISVAAGIVVTRAGSKSTLSNQLADQLFLNPKVLYVCAFMLFGIGVLPGFPSLTFLPLAAAFAGVGFISSKKVMERAENNAAQQIEDEEEVSSSRENVESLLKVDTISLEVGVGLIPLVDSDQDGEILERIISSRKQFAQDLGVIVPMVMVRDNIQLQPGEYQILLKGNVIASGKLMPDYLLAMGGDDVIEKAQGIPTKEPAYGLDAVWIKPKDKADATFNGYTVVNNSTVVVTHLQKVIGEHAPDLIGRQEVQALVDQLKQESPKVVDEVLSADGLSLGEVSKILQNLLKEGVSVRDLLTIFEAIADHCKVSKHPDHLTRHVRIALGRSIVKKFVDEASELKVIALDQATEDIVRNHIEWMDDGSTINRMPHPMANQLVQGIAAQLGKFSETGAEPILMCGANSRWEMQKLCNRFIPILKVLAWDEIPSEVKPETVAIISL